jgi:DNA polymerase III sliding clamp (beta) subunit (PCNA family)
MQWQQGTLHLVSTDSYRLMHACLPRLDEGEDMDVIVPERAFDWLRKTAKLLGSSVGHIGFSERWLVLRAGHVIYVTAPQAGRFPVWRDIVPQTRPDTVQLTVGREDLLAACQRLQPFCGHADRVHWASRGKVVHMSARDSVLGHAHEELDGEGAVGLDAEASYTNTLLIQILQKLHVDEVVLSWPDGHSGPMLVRALDGQVEYLQMPLHTGEI